MEKVVTEAWKKFSKTEQISTKEIPKGFKNTSFLVTTANGGRYVVKVYAQDFLGDGIISSYSKIVKALKNKKCPVIEVVQGLDGEYLQHVKEGKKKYQVTVSKYVEESSTSAAYLNKKLVKSLAFELGKFHRRLREVKLPTDYRVLDPIGTLKDLLTKDTQNKIEDYFVANVKRQKRLKQYVKEYLVQGKAILEYFEERWDRIKDDRQLIHGDFNLSNLDIRDGEIKTIFDFDEMTLAPVAFEIGCSIVHLDEGFMFTDELFEEFVSCYVKHYTLTEDDIRDVFMFMKYRAFYRISRYFTYYRFSQKAVEHFTKYQYKLDRYEKMDLEKLLSYLSKAP